MEAEPHGCLQWLTLGTSAPVDHARPTVNRAMDTAAAEKMPAPEMSNMSRLLRRRHLNCVMAPKEPIWLLGMKKLGPSSTCSN